MSRLVDITKDVWFNLNDDDLLPLTKCKCGEKFTLWDFAIGMEEDDPYECDACGRKLVFRTNIQVFEVVDDPVS